MNPRPGPGHRVSSTFLLRSLTLLLLLAAGIAAYAAWVAPLWLGDGWWLLRACSLFVLPVLIAAWIASWLVPPRGSRGTARNSSG